MPKIPAQLDLISSSAHFQGLDFRSGPAFVVPVQTLLSVQDILLEKLGMVLSERGQALAKNAVPSLAAPLQDLLAVAHGVLHMARTYRLST